MVKNKKLFLKNEERRDAHSPLLFSIILEILAREIRQEKKKHPNFKRRKNITIADNMILYRENSKVSKNN